MVFDHLGISDHSLCDILNDEYLIISPLKPHLIDGAKEVLDYLYPKYPLHLITNGFIEIQGQKLESSEITHFFGEMFTSQRAEAKKPDPKIFEFALSTLGLEKEDVIMIGDNAETDIRGAANAGIDTIYYAPNYTQKHPLATHTIGHLLQLKDLL
jgi:putative hydrolase of the HAD superfamily